MSLGPIEILVIRFPGNQFKGEIVPALQDVVDKGLVRVIDIAFAMKDEAGDLLVTEINEVDDDTFDAFGNLVEDEIPGLLADEDIDRIADAMEPNSSGLLLVFEHTWARRLADAVVGAKGQVVLNQRIPRAVIEELMAEA
jgi:hypothetical protein